jgi:hypothetical protein
MTKQKAESENVFDNLDSLTRPRDIAFEKGNWFKMNKVGDKVEGYIVDVCFRKAEGIYKDQRCITLKTLDGEFVNVAIKRLPFILSKTDGLRIGDPLRVEFDSTLPSDKGNPAKVMAFYGKKLPENTGKTVAELDREDQALQGVKAEEAEIKPEDVPFE